MKFIDLFSGVGAVEMALKELGIDFTTVGISEIAKNPIKMYNDIHGKTLNFGDIKKIKELPECDYIHFSSPCQSFSLAAKATDNQTGINGKSGLILEVYRLFDNYKERNILPKYFTFENVKELTEKFKDDWNDFLKFFDNIGYNVTWDILRAVDFDTPQLRERVFAVGIRKDLNETFEMPQGHFTNLRLKDFLLPHEEVSEEFYHPDIRAKERHFRKLPPKEKSPIELGYYYTEKSKKRCQTNKIYSPEGLAPTLTTTNGINLEVGTERLRQITPQETWRLMGFKDEDFYKIKNMPKSAIISACGNSIALGPIKAILKNLFLKEEN